MPDIQSLPPLRDIIKEHDLRAEKKFGQNFLLDLNLTNKIARVAKNIEGATVFEVGPGPGGLTRSLLLAGAKKVIAIEFDDRAIKALESLRLSAGPKLEIIHADALNTDLICLAEAPRLIVANLPYNIATPLLINWLSQIRDNSSNYIEMILMFQKEVAQRITAKVGEKAYGRLSVLSQWLCDTKTAFDVPASAFTPPPKVTSSVVHLIPKQLAGQQPDFKSIEKITEKAFGQRRKMIRSSLKEYQQFFSEAGVEETMRAENIVPEQYIKLALLSQFKDHL